MTDRGERVAVLYQQAHERIVELVRTLTPEQVAAPVPATPGWTVHDVLAHLVAIPTDALGGRISGVPTDDITAEQAESRRDNTVEELLAEWSANVPAMVEGARAGLVPVNLAVDAVTHEQDIRGAVNRGRVPDRDAVRFCLKIYAAGVAHKLAAHGAPPVRIAATDSEFERTTGAGEPVATVCAEEFELFRALSGRRGRDALLAMQWSGDRDAVIDALNVFGSVPGYAVVD